MMLHSECVPAVCIVPLYDVSASSYMYQHGRALFNDTIINVPSVLARESIYNIGNAAYNKINHDS
jgi:hypothetical protein